MIYLAVGLVVMAGAVIYVRRRLGEALAQLGSSGRAVRIVQRVLALAVFAYPVLAIGSMVGSRVLGFATMPRFDGPVATWLLVIPFILTTLVVFQSLPWLFALELVRLVVQGRRAPALRARVRVWGTLVVVGAFAVYTPVRILAQRDEVRFRVHRLGQGPATDAPLRIAFVSDVHVDAHTRPSRVAELFAQINRGHPRPHPLGRGMDQHRPRLHRRRGHGRGRADQPARYVLGARRSRELRVPRSCA